MVNDVVNTNVSREACPSPVHFAPLHRAAYLHDRHDFIAMASSSFDTPFFNSLNRTKVPHVFLTAETEDFDEDIIQKWTDEGFDVHYVPLLNGGKEFSNRLHAAGDGLGVGENFMVVGNWIEVATVAHHDAGLIRMLDSLR